MNLDKARALVESERFAAEMGVASGYRSFEEALESSSPFRQLLDFAAADPDNVQKILQLLQRLSEQRIDDRYENPNDTALAAYVKAIRLVSPQNAEVAAGFSMDAPNTWWSRQVAERVLREPVTPTHLSNVGFSNWITSHENKIPIFNTYSNALQSSLISNFLGANFGQVTSKFQLSISTLRSNGELSIDTSMRSYLMSERSGTVPLFWELAA